jgi:hypothetical protein
MGSNDDELLSDTIGQITDPWVLDQMECNFQRRIRLSAADSPPRLVLTPTLSEP